MPMMSLVQLIILRVKSGKTDGASGLSSDHFIYTCQELSDHVSMLFSALLIQRLWKTVNNLLHRKSSPLPTSTQALLSLTASLTSSQTKFPNFISLSLAILLLHPHTHPPSN